MSTRGSRGRETRSRSPTKEPGQQEASSRKTSQKPSILKYSFPAQQMEQVGSRTKSCQPQPKEQSQQKSSAQSISQKIPTLKQSLPARPVSPRTLEEQSPQQAHTQSIPQKPPILKQSLPVRQGSSRTKSHQPKPDKPQAKTYEQWCWKCCQTQHATHRHRHGTKGSRVNFWRISTLVQRCEICSHAYCFKCGDQRKMQIEKKSNSGGMKDKALEAILWCLVEKYT